MKCTRQRCQEAWKTFATAAFDALVGVGDHQLDPGEASPGRSAAG